MQININIMSHFVLLDSFKGTHLKCICITVQSTYYSFPFHAGPLLPQLRYWNPAYMSIPMWSLIMETFGWV